MPLLDRPLRFEPFLRPMVWGGRSLQTRLGKRLPNGAAYGESWEVSDHPLCRSKVAAGPFAGTDLRHLMLEHRSELLGAAASEHDVFPWLVKFLDCRDWLSVQVHPDTATVRKLRPGEGSKTEAWFVLHAEPTGRVYAGLKPGVGPNDFRAALARGQVAELLHSFQPQSGDCVFLPAGTVHAVGGGVLMAEIQETSDVTFRLYDWDRVDAEGRRRELHIEESFASIHWDAGPVTPIRTGERPANQPAEQALVRCPFFELDFHRIVSPASIEAGRLRTLIVVAGAGAWDDGTPIATGEVWVLPAAMRNQQVHPNGSVTYLLGSLPK